MTNIKPIKIDKRTQPRVFLLVWRDLAHPNQLGAPDFTSRSLEVMAVQRGPDIQHAGQWGLLGGRVDPGELDVEAIEREVHEECGCNIRASKLYRLGAVDVKRRPVTYFALNEKFVVGEFTFTAEISANAFLLSGTVPTKDNFHYSLRNVPGLEAFWGKPGGSI